jgi:hypothetical protein
VFLRLHLKPLQVHQHLLIGLQQILLQQILRFLILSGLVEPVCPHPHLRLLLSYLVEHQLAHLPLHLLLPLLLLQLLLQPYLQLKCHLMSLFQRRKLSQRLSKLSCVPLVWIFL